MAYKFSVLYIALIVLVNYAFSIAPEYDFYISMFVGLVFVVRDYAQRELGHGVLVAMLVAGLISYVMADPFVALASVTAFLVSELADWAVYSFTKRPFAQRVLLSSAIGTPIDSIVFLQMIDLLSWQTVVMITISKMIGALIVWWMIRRRDTDTQTPAAA